MCVAAAAQGAGMGGDQKRDRVVGLSVLGRVSAGCPQPSVCEILWGPCPHLFMQMPLQRRGWMALPKPGSAQWAAIGLLHLQRQVLCAVQFT
jgi:hypothetical protein